MADPVLLYFKPSIWPDVKCFIAGIYNKDKIVLLMCVILYM